MTYLYEILYRLRSLTGFEAIKYHYNSPCSFTVIQYNSLDINRANKSYFILMNKSIKNVVKMTKVNNFYQQKYYDSIEFSDYL